MPEIDYELARFFAWARARAFEELNARLQVDPSLDPNWTFSDIMQRLLEEYRSANPQRPEPAEQANNPE
ncbi:MAG: hypothetical protein AB7U82_20385 [Blastocatellales bacterium]